MHILLGSAMNLQVSEQVQSTMGNYTNQEEISMLEEHHKILNDDVASK
jgi:hypothetical protein